MASSVPARCFAVPKTRPRPLGPPGLGLPPGGLPIVATVGTFDGVHRGHWSILRELRARAAACRGRSALVTFEPHPLRVVRPEAAPSLLTTAAEKKALLAESGLDYAVFLPFTQALRNYSPRRFVHEILLTGLGVTELVVGYNHGFGRGRSGDTDTLRAIAAEAGFLLDVVGPYAAGGRPVSSSSIRQMLAEGRLDEANRGLGRPYALEGVVTRGHGRGRALGFPTANLRVAGAHKLLPGPGIYACWTTASEAPAPGLPARPLMGALHIGPRPVFPGAGDSVEVHLLGFEGDLYGRRLRIEIVRRLRSVAEFPSASALAARMRQDVDQVRDVLEPPAEAPAPAAARPSEPCPAAANRALHRASVEAAAFTEDPAGQMRQEGLPSKAVCGARIARDAEAPEGPAVAGGPEAH